MQRRPLITLEGESADPSTDSDLAEQALAIVRRLHTLVGSRAYLGADERTSLLLRLEEAADTLQEAVFLDAWH